MRVPAGCSELHRVWSAAGSQWEVISWEYDVALGKIRGLSGEIRYPTMKQLERLHDRILQMGGGDRGYLNRSNLEYLLDAVKDIGERLGRRESLTKKAAFLLHNSVVLHPFVNGNKRTAYELVRLFLRLNGYDINTKSEEAYRFLLELASGKMSAIRVENWIATNLTGFDG